jgi:tetratricopeptide (TPR) repeat protein
MTGLKYIPALMCAAILAALTALSCTNRFDMNTVEGLLRLENPTYRDRPVPRNVVDQLAPLVAEYKARVTEYADDAEQLQLMYKSIAQHYLDIGFYQQQVEYYLARVKEKRQPPSGGRAGLYYDYAAVMLMEKGLYAEAYANIMESLKLSPTNPYLLYYAGYCAGLMGKAIKPENGEANRVWLDKALDYYSLALEADPDYVDALYGKSIILVYETGQPEDAIPLLMRIKTKNRENIDAMFVLAAAYTMTGDYRSALSEYENIENLSAVEEQRKAARENIERLKKML